MVERSSKSQLKDLARVLGENDMSVLKLIRMCRYLTTRQVSRLYFSDSPSGEAALKAAHRCLKKLKGYALLETLDRRIGGIRGGSGSFIWRLSSSGEHFLRLADKSSKPRRRLIDPSPQFTKHLLAVSECYVRITEICAAEKVKLSELLFEPDCWRPYNKGGEVATLRPDLFVATVCGGYEDRWFFELDLDTESPVRIMDKCRRYQQYYQSGLEQKQYGVFPLVVFVVPDTARKESIAQSIQKEFSKLPRIFGVILPDELGALIVRGACTATGGCK